MTFAIRAVLLALAAWTLAIPLHASDDSGETQHVLGKCKHTNEEVGEWLTTLGFGSRGSFACASASLDWQNQLTFFRDVEGEQLAIRFNGTASDDGSGFTVTSIEEYLLDEVPASGGCRMILKAAEPRRIQCQATPENKRPELVMVEMQLEDIVWETGSSHNDTGKCHTPIGISQALVAMIADQTGEMPQTTLASPIDCNQRIVRVGDSYSFATEAGGVKFSVSEDEQSPGRKLVEMVTFSDGSSVEPVVGVCLDIRLTDGELASLCAAAFAKGDQVELLEVAFAPKGSPTPWSD